MVRSLRLDVYVPWVNGSYNIRTRHGGREQVGHGARTDATMWRVADRMYPGDRHPMRASARCHLYRSPVLHTPPFIHAVVICVSAECLSCATQKVSGCSRGCWKVGARTSGRQVGASVERCVHNRREGAVHGGDTHIGSASGHKRRAMCAQSTRRRGARDMAWGVGRDGRALSRGGWSRGVRSGGGAGGGEGAS